MNIQGLNVSNYFQKPAAMKSAGVDFATAMNSAKATSSYSATSSSEPAAMASLKPKEADSAQEFMDYMQKTSAEKMVKMWLARKGYTEEEFKNLPPEKQEALMKQMQEELTEQMKRNAQSGQAVSIVI